MGGAGQRAGEESRALVRSLCLPPDQLAGLGGGDI